LYGSYQTNLFPGAATYTSPIEVPKGTNDLQPFISIQYNSQSVKQRPSILGAGWSLTQDYIMRFVNGSPENTSNDFFKLSFMGSSYDLVYDTSDGFYHTKTETFLRIQNLSGISNTYGTYWQVTTKDGTQFRFGFTNNSELTSNSGYNYAVRWSLDLVTDTYGNTINYTYNEDPNSEDKGSVYLSNITYNRDGKRKVSFNYETNARPDRWRVYEQGNLLEESRRLASINITYDKIPVRSYKFEYTKLSEGLTSLYRISYLGSNSGILHNVSFDYYSSSPGYKRFIDSWVAQIFIQI